MTDQSRTHVEKMSGQKRAACSDEIPPAKKQWFRSGSQRATETRTSAWLKYEKADRDYMVTLKCSLCIQFEKLGGMCNCNPAFVVGSKNL